MQKYYRLIGIMLLLALAINMSCGKQDEPDTPMNGLDESAKASPPDSKQEIPVFHLCLPSSLKEPLQGIIFTDVFNTLKEKYGADQEKFTVRISSKEEWMIPDLLEKMDRKEIDVFIGSLLYSGKRNLELDRMGYRYKKLGLAPIAVVVSKSFKGPMNLTPATLQDILTAKIDDWSTISSGLSGKITVYVPHKIAIGQWLRIIQWKDMLEKADIKEEPVDEIIKKVSQDKDSIAVIPVFGFDSSMLKDISILSIDNALPTDELAVITGKYELTAPVCVIWRAEITNHRFFEEFMKKLDDTATLGKLRIFKKNKLVIAVPSALIGPLNNEIIPSVLKTLKDKQDYQPPQLTFYEIERFLLSHKINIGEVDIYITPFLKHSEVEFELRGFHHKNIGTSALVAIVSKDMSGITNLSSTALKDIVTGKIGNWSEISSDLSGKIKVYNRVTEFLQKSFKISEKIERTTMETMECIKDQVAAEKNSIGLVWLPVLSEADRQKVTILNIDGISPTEENLKLRKYPYPIPYHLVWENDMDSDKFLEEFSKIIDDERTLKKIGVYK